VKVARDVKAISKILFILILLLAMIIGSIFSYMILAGYYLNLESNIPEKPTLSVLNVSLDPENAESFTITVLNPTYSVSEATIKDIYIITPDEQLDKVLSINPTLPLDLGVGKEETFTCDWNWGNYFGETLTAVIVVEDGSGAVYEIKTAAVGLDITAAVFNTDDTQHFNLTIRNPSDSIIDLSLTKITLTMENDTEFIVRDTTPSIPRTLNVDTYTTFECAWDWTNYRGGNITISIYTSQGYESHITKTTPRSVQLSITDTNFNTSNMSRFAITVENSENSLATANLTQVQIQLEDYTIVDITVESPELPYTLNVGDTVTLNCIWNWEDHRAETISIAVESAEGYIGYTSTQLP
jgi:hypothetical protein